jgi:hypothetical protein
VRGLLDPEPEEEGPVLRRKLKADLTINHRHRFRVHGEGCEGLQIGGFDEEDLYLHLTPDGQKTPPPQKPGISTQDDGLGSSISADVTTHPGLLAGRKFSEIPSIFGIRESVNSVLRPGQLVVMILAGWVNRRQQEIIEFQNAQIQALMNKLGRKRILLTDDQRRVLAVKGKALGRKTSRS